MQNYINRFLNHLNIEKNVSNHTITAYSKDLEQFVLFLSTFNNSIESFSDVSPKVVRQWVVDLHENEMTPRTIHRKISSVRSFYKYLQRQQVLEENPLLYIPLPKTPKKLPLFVRESEMEALLDSFDYDKDYPSIRNKLIIELFYGTGIRLSELVNLKVKDVDLQSKVVKVLGKGNKERIIPLTNESIRLLKEYNIIREKSFTTKSEWLFLTNKGAKIYDKLVYRVVNTSLSRVTTLKKRSPHILRHTYATVLLNRGADLNAIKELLGHSNLNATQIYTHNSIEEINAIYKQAHPRA